MKKYYVAILALSWGAIHAWSGDAKKEGAHLDFYGKLTSRQDKTEPVNNIGIGYDRDSARVRQIPMYEKPANAQKGSSNGLMIIPSDPKTSLVESFIDLDEIQSLSVPHPNTTWRYTPDNSSTGYDYIEVTIVAKNGDSTNYLLELGRQGTKRPTKVFCCSIHHKKTDQQLNDTLFCSGVRTSELEEKGVPLAAIKQLVIEGYCQRKPVDAKG